MNNSDDWYEEDPSAEKQLAQRQIDYNAALSQQQGFREGMLQQSDIVEENLKIEGFKAGYEQGYAKAQEQEANRLIAILAKKYGVPFELRQFKTAEEINEYIQKIII